MIICAVATPTGDTTPGPAHWRHIGYGWRVDAGRAYCKVCNYKCAMAPVGASPGSMLIAGQ